MPFRRLYHIGWHFRSVFSAAGDGAVAG
jgi:hypothetical protein